jgi:uncharacterized protein (DUF4415 family)
MRKIVRREFDPANPPRLTAKAKAEIKALRESSDGAIDQSDIPELTEKFWRNAGRNPYYRPIKQQLTLRLDADLVAWFKRHAKEGRGYQTGINRALREYVERHANKKAG